MEWQGYEESQLNKGLSDRIVRSHWTTWQILMGCYNSFKYLQIQGVLPRDEGGETKMTKAELVQKIYQKKQGYPVSIKREAFNSIKNLVTSFIKQYF